MTPSRIFLYLCLFFISGIFLNSTILTPQLGFSAITKGYIFFLFLCLAFFFILSSGLISLVFKKIKKEDLPKYPVFLTLKGSDSAFLRKKLAVMGFCLLFLVLGIWRHQVVELRVINDELRGYNNSGNEIILVGVVAQEPDIRETTINLTIGVQQLILDNESLKTRGKVLITTHRYPEYRYGDKLKITGELKTPQEGEEASLLLPPRSAREGEEASSFLPSFAGAREFEGFSYRNYLKKDKIYSVMSWPKIETIDQNQGNPIFSRILLLKENLRKTIYQNLPPSQGSILGAMILGDKRMLSAELKEKLSVVGIRHIVAISGLHITVLTAILMNLLMGLGFWRQQSFYFAVILITVFIVMTGLQPSAVRAGIMGGLFLLGQYFGRLSVSSRAIVFAASAMLFFNPFLLRLDIGFQLSFLAMIGIIYLLPSLKGWLKFVSWENPKSILAMTFSAYFFTLPVLIYNFGYFSSVAPLTNLLVVPLLYWIMAFGFLFSFLGIFWQVFAFVFSLPVRFMLVYLMGVVDWFSGFSWARIFLQVHWFWLLIAYIGLGFFVFQLNKRKGLVISKI